MKQLLLLITILVCFTACDMNTSQTSAITILADRTDPAIPAPTVADVRSLLHLNDSPNMGADIRLQNIGNVDYNPIYQKQLPTSSLFENNLQRNADIKRFYADIDTLIRGENDKVYNYQSSSIMMPLLLQLEALQISNNTSNHVLLYSDLAEFSDIYNVYDYTSLKQLQEQPLVVAEHVKSKLTIPKLDGVTLTIVYYPKTNQQNRLFQNMIQLYRHVFKESGLRINIGLQQSLK